MKNGNNKTTIIVGVILLIITLIIFVPGLIKDKKSLDTSKLEYNLILEGKTISSREIAEKFLEQIKNKNYEEAKKYLANDCEFYNYSFTNTNVNSLDFCLEKLEDYSTSRIELRGNGIKGEESYRIYWNEESTSQIITIQMRKKVTNEVVTYEIIKIMFNQN